MSQAPLLLPCLAFKYRIYSRLMGQCLDKLLGCRLGQPENPAGYMLNHSHIDQPSLYSRASMDALPLVRSFPGSGKYSNLLKLSSSARTVRLSYFPENKGTLIYPTTYYDPLFKWSCKYSWAPNFSNSRSSHRVSPCDKIFALGSGLVNMKI
jgi:hypothetical protein